MSAARLGTRIALCAGLGLILTACGSSAPEDGAGGAGSSVPLVDNFPSGSAGQSSGLGFKAWSKDSGGSAGSLVGTAGSAGTAGNTSAAGGGGSAGSAGAASAVAGSAGAADSGTPVEPDPLDILGLGSAGAGAESDPLDIFGTAGAAADAPTCEGLICTELADCVDLYPEQHASCKFTRCEDLECK